MYSFPYLEPVCCSMSSSNCCFLTCIQISQEADQVVWSSHLLKNFAQFVVIHTVKGFGIVNKAEIDVFLELSCFFNDPMDTGNLISGSSAFSKSSSDMWKFMVHRPQPCLTQWNYEPCQIGPPKTDESWWTVLTKCNPLEKGLANHFSILALRNHEQYEKAKR